MNFVVDGMLGKLARWLRMMGHDVIYFNEMDDKELLEVSKKENRVLLTRDEELFKRALARGIEAFYVAGSTQAERLAELSNRYHLPLEIDLERSHCPRCNGRLSPLPKEQAASKVEKNTLKYYDAFWQCANCGLVYWQGSHWTKILATLKEAEEKNK